MEMNNYQERARSTAMYPDVGANLCYPVLGLCGESGEVAEKVKKVMRDEGGVVTPEKREELKIELGDVLWYVANVAAELGVTLEEVADGNIKKLCSRKSRGKIQGDGDNR